MDTLALPQAMAWPVRHLPLKRVIDLALGGALLVLLSPLFLLLWTLIRFSSKGPILFTDSRVGRGGRAFRCYKFRTMFTDAEQRLSEVLKSDPAARRQWHLARKLRHDPRITPVGYWLRRLSLDELPQLWNVMIGDMSLVGPRPVTQTEIEQYYSSKAAKILQVRPGITGLWQVSGRSRLSYHKRVALDEQYVDCRCLLLDLKILLRTIPAVLLLRGAY